MKILVTGSDGFVGKNLVTKLNELNEYFVITHVSQDDSDTLVNKVNECDVIFHLAGSNRPKDKGDFTRINVDLTDRICSILLLKKTKTKLVFSSSTQAELNNDYGQSKLKAEKALEKLANDSKHDVKVLRLPNLFGKWCKPNYNSVVATFCHNIANDLPISVNTDAPKFTLMYVDDLVDYFIKWIREDSDLSDVVTYETTVESLAKKIEAYHKKRKDLSVANVGSGFDRALYSTYLTYLSKENFSYEIPKYEDERGLFSEFLKTPSCGQFSFFTAHPGVTRGGHYHHSKVEKFLIVKGKALFRFKNIITNEFYELETSSDKLEVVETIPGWTHDVKNIGDEELISIIWANEVFDREKPDTIQRSLSGE